MEALVLDESTFRAFSFFVAVAAFLVAVLSALFSWRTSQSSIKSNDFKIIVDFSKELSTRWKQVASAMEKRDEKRLAAETAARTATAQSAAPPVAAATAPAAIDQTAVAPAPAATVPADIDPNMSKLNQEIDACQKSFEFEIGELYNYIEILCGMINRNSIPKATMGELSVILHAHIHHIFSVSEFVELYRRLRRDDETFPHIEKFVLEFWAKNPNGADLRRNQADALHFAVKELTTLK